MKVTVVGSGYVGLVSAACLAEVGNQVVGLDVDEAKIHLLNSGEVPIYEPGLKEMIERNRKAGRLSFTANQQAAARHGQVHFLAVGTPPGEDGSADVQYVQAAAVNIGRHAEGWNVVINKSTVPVGTARLVTDTLQKESSGRKNVSFSVVSNPEFLKEGSAIKDFMRPDRIVVGSDNPEAIRIMRELYHPFHRSHDRMIVMDIPSAELTKYAANAMLATRISFMNELSRLAEKVGADIEHVRAGIGSDTRIGHAFLYAGCGYGGSCFPKDVRALIHMGDKADASLNFLKEVQAVNERQKEVLLSKIFARFGEDLADKKFALWGLAFKPQTDDMREAPSVILIERLIQRGATVLAYDPVAMPEAQKMLAAHSAVIFGDDALSITKDADALIVVTEWQEFRSPDFQALAGKLKHKVIFDGRNLYHPQELASLGFEYFSIGRMSVASS